MQYRRTGLRPEQKPEEKITYLSEYWDLFCEIADIIDNGREIGWKTMFFRLKLHEFAAFVGDVEEDVIKMGIIGMASMDKDNSKGTTKVPGEVISKIIGVERIDDERMYYLARQAQEHLFMIVPDENIDQGEN